MLLKALKTEEVVHTNESQSMWSKYPIEYMYQFEKNILK